MKVEMRKKFTFWREVRDWGKKGKKKVEEGGPQILLSLSPLKKEDQEGNRNPARGGIR